MTDTTTHICQTTAESTSSTSRWQRPLFVIAAILATTWVILLLVLSVTAANPVTLNRDQISESVDVLTVLVKDSQTGTVQIEKSWKSVVRDRELKITDLASLGVTTGERFVIPIFRDDDRWHVMPSKLPKNPRLVYPVTDEAERQLKSILKTGHLPY